MPVLARPSTPALRPDESQAAGRDADTNDMQFSTQAARGASELGSIRSLHLSLNAPVISIDELPVGPARAGVALCELPEGGLHLEIAIRSLRTGEVVAVATDVTPVGPGEDTAAIEAALSYAEGMGFLFDEDEIGSGGGEAADKAGSLWRDLVEEVPERSRVLEAAAAVDLSTPAEADDVVHEVPVRESGSDVASITVEHGAPEIELTAEAIIAVPPAELLSKFRLTLAGHGPGRDPIAAGLGDQEAAPEPPPESRIRLLRRY